MLQNLFEGLVMSKKKKQNSYMNLEYLKILVSLGLFTHNISIYIF